MLGFLDPDEYETLLSYPEWPVSRARPIYPCPFYLCIHGRNFLKWILLAKVVLQSSYFLPPPLIIFVIPGKASMYNQYVIKKNPKVVLMT